MDNKPKNPLEPGLAQPVASVQPQEIRQAPVQQQQAPPVTPPTSGIMYEQEHLEEERSIFDRLPKVDQLLQGPYIKIGGAVLAVIILIIIIMRVIFPMVGGNSSQVTLVYWGLWEDQKTMDVIFTEFEKTHPNIDVKYEKQDVKSLGKYMDRLATRVENGTGPDLFRYHVAWLPSIRTRLAPLPADVVKNTQLETSYYDTVKTDLSQNGAYYGIPIGIDTLALFVNTQIFEAAGIADYPKTWDDFVKVARTITVREGGGQITTAGAAMGSFDNVAHASDIVSLLLVQNGADMSDLAGPKRKNAEDALEFYASFAKGENQVWDDRQDNSKLAFARGNVGMYFGYSWDIFEIKQAAPDLRFVIVQVPHVSGVNPNRDKTIASYWVEGVSVKSAYSKEAFELMTFMAQKDTLEKLYTAQSKTRLFGEPYPRKDMKELLKNNALVYPFVAQADKASSTIFPSDTHDEGAISVLNGYLGNAVRSIVGNTSPQSAIDSLAQGVEQVISRYE